jgi:hypothetical protein
LNFRKERGVMEDTTYECKKCGKKFAVSGKGKKHLVPVYCCGEEAVKSIGKKPAVGEKNRK